MNDAHQSTMWQRAVGGFIAGACSTAAGLRLVYTQRPDQRPLLPFTLVASPVLALLPAVAVIVLCWLRPKAQPWMAVVCAAVAWPSLVGALVGLGACFSDAAGCTLHSGVMATAGAMLGVTVLAAPGIGVGALLQAGYEIVLARRSAVRRRA
jgi:hypothetical protein